MTEEQARLFELLLLFKQLCVENSLQYYLAGGTLLGAVRHQGFIPWDDDIDVSMPVIDFLKFQDLSKLLPPNMKIQSEKSDPYYPFVFIKLCNTDYSFYTGYPNGPEGIYIDIFPLIPSKNPSWFKRFHFNIISTVNYVLQVKFNWTEFVPYKSLMARFLFWILGHFSTKSLKIMRRKYIRSLYDSRSKESLCSPGGAYRADKEFFPTDWYKESVELIFEGEYFSVPAGWDAYLSRNYGNYMQLPPLEMRRSQHKREDSENS